MSVDGTTQIAGVFGWPIGHSRSPRLHGYWLEKYRINGAYLPFAVAPERLETAVKGLVALGLRGVNVTVPHKERVATLVDRLDSVAARIGAVNLIVVGADNTLEGRNTDAFGFIQNLKHQAPAWMAKSGPAVVIGAGGAARAVVVGLLDAGVSEVRIVNRTRERGDALAATIGGPISVEAWVSRETVLRDASLIVNTTMAGMVGQPPLDLYLDGVPRSVVVADIVYTPIETRLLAMARARGNPTVDGLGMLLHQARPSFQAWFGVDPEVDDGLRTAVYGG